MIRPLPPDGLPQVMVPRRKLFTLKATVSYIVFAAAWILLSDQALNANGVRPPRCPGSPAPQRAAVHRHPSLILWVALQNAQ